MTLSWDASTSPDVAAYLLVLYLAGQRIVVGEVPATDLSMEYDIEVVAGEAAKFWIEAEDWSGNRSVSHDAD